jgi:hypothetical protein
MSTKTLSSVLYGTAQFEFSAFTGAAVRYVKQHGGSIDVDTEPGLFTEFKIVCRGRASCRGRAKIIRLHPHSDQRRMEAVNCCSA